jgi:hypothetical protein
MRVNRRVGFILCLGAVFIMIMAGCFYWQRYNINEFSCMANFVKHHPDEKLDIKLSFIFGTKNGMLSMSGHTQKDPSKIFNRKISFSFQKKGSTFYLHSEKNIKFPGDNIDDSWLEKFIPKFFVYPDKDIYTTILKQNNGSYLFIYSTLPSYVCYSK